ncbi:hypothetical protein [Paenibacillus illinoisensis]|uniref:hypothetical protein n=1 Tax=Paenibacillus illinoisensis TaxID=59845 RepID=UPI0036F30EDE
MVPILMRIFICFIKLSYLGFAIRIKSLACFLCALPLLLAFLFLQKYFIGGMTVGAVKG